MVTLEPIGFARSTRSDLADDNWGGVTARIKLAESLSAEILDGVEAFSHAEFERGARPRPIGEHGHEP